MVVIALTKWLSKILYTKYLSISAMIFRVQTSDCWQIKSIEINCHYFRIQPGLLGFFIFYIDDFFSFVELLHSTVAVICNRFAVRAWTAITFKKTLKTHELCELADFSRGMSYSMSTSWAFFYETLLREEWQEWLIWNPFFTLYECIWHI